MDLHDALSWAAERRTGTLVTLRSDGRPQSSDVVYLVEGPAMVVSVTADRAKTANMRRDPRVVLHVSDPANWSYASFDGTVELSGTAADPSDPVCDRLVAYYEAVAGEEHPDWDEYRRAMVAERRLLATFTPTTAVGQF